MRMHVEHKGKQKEQRVSAPSAEPMNDAAQDAAFRKPDSIAFSGAVSFVCAVGAACVVGRGVGAGASKASRKYRWPLPAAAVCAAVTCASRSQGGIALADGAWGDEPRERIRAGAVCFEL